MRKLTKVVALIVTVGLLSQPMAFAQTDQPVSLAKVQEQARQDAEFLQKKYGLLMTGGLISVGTVFSLLYVIYRDKKIIAQQQKDIAKLEKELDQSTKESALKAENNVKKTTTPIKRLIIILFY